MNADQVQTIINEAAKNLPGHLALILTTECAAEHYQPPPTLH